MSLAAENAATLSSSAVTNQIAELRNEIGKLIQKQDYLKAIPLARKVLELNQSVKGNEDPSNEQHLNNLGWLLQQKGDYAEARRLFEKSIEIAEQLNSSDAEYVWSLNNLAALLYFQGDYEKAKLIFERALNILEKLTDKDQDWQKQAHLYRNLAGTLDALDKGEQALAYYKKAIELIEAQKPVDQIELAQALDDLAVSLEDKHKYDESLLLFERALKIKESFLGAEHIDLAQCLNNIAVLYMDTKRKGQAKPLLDRAISISEKIMGHEHVSLVPLLNNLGDFYFLSNDKVRAFDLYLKASKLINLYFTSVLPGSSVAEQQAAIDQYSNTQVSRLLSSAKTEEQIEAAYAEIFCWKGALVESLSRESRIRRVVDSPEFKTKLEQLSRVRTEIATWYQAIGTVTLKDWQQENQRLSAEKEKLEREISASYPQIGSFQLDLAEFKSRLKSDEVFIDIYRFAKFECKAEQMEITPSYAAIITLPTALKSEKNNSMIEMGNSDLLELKSRLWRDEVLSMKVAENSWKQLSSAVTVIAEKLPVNAGKAYLCPDAELCRIPWHLLLQKNSQQRPLALCQIDSAREFASFGSANKAQSPVSGNTVLVLSAVDFNAGADSRIKPNIYLPPLPGTAEEGNEVCKLAKSNKMAVIELAGAAATKAALLSFLPSVQFAHLATHGYFLDASFVNAMTNLQKPASRAIVLKARPLDYSAARNPLVESGIALAGANKAKHNGVADQNCFLSAEEFVDLDLSKCKLLTLSACDTGRGHEITGQGVMGLRSSVMAAGASNVLMSLWKVPDLATSNLMQELYKNIWQKKLNLADALLAAQQTLAGKKAPSSLALPINWAGWVLVGEGR